MYERDILLSDLGHAAHVWCLQTARVSGRKATAECLAVLSEHETARYRRYRFDSDRHLYLVAHAMLRQVLSRYADIAPAEWRFRYGDHGRPEIDGPETAVSLRFNLTHTRGLAACIVTESRDCGIDAEAIAVPRQAAGIARRMFAEQEQQALRGLQGQAFMDRFFAYWTLREAYGKACGRGLAGSRAQYWFEPGAGARWHIHFTGAAQDNRRWYLETRQLNAAHQLAVAIDTRRAAGLLPRFREFEF